MQIEELIKMDAGTVIEWLIANKDEFILTTKAEEETSVTMNKNLMEGRHYLMGVEPCDLDVSDALEAFGFGRNGLG